MIAITIRTLLCARNPLIIISVFGVKYALE
jgi:hypothetical protein